MKNTLVNLTINLSFNKKIYFYCLSSQAVGWPNKLVPQSFLRNDLNGFSQQKHVSRLEEKKTIKDSGKM